MGNLVGQLSHKNMWKSHINADVLNILIIRKVASYVQVFVYEEDKLLILFTD